MKWAFWQGTSCWESPKTEKHMIGCESDYLHSCHPFNAVVPVTVWHTVPHGSEKIVFVWPNPTSAPVAGWLSWWSTGIKTVRHQIRLSLSYLWSMGLTVFKTTVANVILSVGEHEMQSDVKSQWQKMQNNFETVSVNVIKLPRVAWVQWIDDVGTEKSLAENWNLWFCIVTTAVVLGFKKCTPWASPGWAEADEVECTLECLLFATKQCNTGAPSAGTGFLGVKKGIFHASS